MGPDSNQVLNVLQYAKTERMLQEGKKISGNDKVNLELLMPRGLDTFTSSESGGPPMTSLRNSDLTHKPSNDELGIRTNCTLSQFPKQKDKGGGTKEVLISPTSNFVEADRFFRDEYANAQALKEEIRFQRATGKRPLSSLVRASETQRNTHQTDGYFYNKETHNVIGSKRPAIAMESTVSPEALLFKHEELSRREVKPCEKQRCMSAGSTR